MANEDLTTQTSVDPGSSTCIDKSVFGYGLPRHAGGDVNQRIATRGSRGITEHISPDQEPKDMSGIATSTLREEQSENNPDIRLPAPVGSSSSIIGLTDEFVPLSGYDPATSDAGKIRKKKSPKQIERARDRQRLARREKRAAKALHSDQDHKVLDGGMISEGSGEVQRNDTSKEKDHSLTPF